MNIHNTDDIKEMSPPKIFFEDKIIKKVNSMLKSEGIYIMFLMCKNKNCYKDSIDSIKRNFNQILYLENNDELNNIIFCFKSKIEKNELMKNYFTNITSLSNKKDYIDIKIIEKSSINLMNKFNEIN